MKKLTIHVLDGARGEPAANMLIRVLDGEGKLCNTAKTAASGRVEPALLSDEKFPLGVYQLQFYVGDYFAELGFSLPKPRFIDIVRVDFGVADDSIHIPLLITPWSYNVYRGS